MDYCLVVNARFLTQRVTGVQRFAIEICRQIKSAYPETVFVTPKNILNLKVAEELNAKVIGNQTGHIWEQVDLPYFLVKQGKPLLLNLANTAPLFYQNKIVTIHDLAFRVNPNWFTWQFSIFYNFLIPKLILRSKHIITVSESVKQELISAFGLPEQKITVVYNAIPKDLSIDSYPVQAKRGLPPSYLLTVSSIDARKNLVRLVKAFKNLNNPHVKLLVIGGENALFSEPELKALLHKTPNVEALGFVSDEELVHVYKNAIGFVYPSLYEGFGIPNIEAMHFGCPVITSDLQVTREVCGDAAVFVNPLSVHEITLTLQTLIENTELQEDLRHKGLKRAQLFTWEKSFVKLQQLISSLL